MQKVLTPGNVSVVVCTKNAVDIIRPCLESLSRLSILEVIVVDAGSTDGTREIVHEYGYRLASDNGEGLAAARNLGIQLSSGDLILNFGPDNTTTLQDLAESIAYLADSGCAGISFTTSVDGSGYLAKAMNFWRSVRFRTGPAKVIGTPTLFYSSILKLNPYNASRNHSDDGELCDRLASLGHRFAIGPGNCFEHGKTNLASIVETWGRYGTSDFEHFNAHLSNKSSLKTLLSSLAHPLRVELLIPMRTEPVAFIPYLPFLLLLVFLRYSGWLRVSLRHK
jgi:hypothetical protein